MSENYVSLLEYLKSECGRDYKLFVIADTVETLNSAYFNFEPISNDQFRLMIRELYNGEYIDLKHLDEDVALLKPLSKSFSIKKEVEKKQEKQEIVVERKDKKEWVFFLISFACSFIGALLGGLIC